MDSFDNQENKLKQQMKQLCDMQGREMDKTKSASVLHKLGLLYQTKSPHKISLIQSAALLNAAIARDRSCPEYMADL